MALLAKLKELSKMTVNVWGFTMSNTVFKDFRFRFDRSLQAAAYFVKLAGGVEYHLRLLKLLYIADRHYLLSYGEMITGDHVVALKHGPVLTNIFDLIKGRGVRADKWACHLQTLPESHKIRLIDDPRTGSLCRASQKLLDDVYTQYGRMSRFQLRDLTHTFPEWKKYFREGAAMSIPWEDILRLNGGEKMVPSAMNSIEVDEYQYALLGVG